jgi:VIT1/CCC1 family predicted Fe2+/Mn2+ transporter
MLARQVADQLTRGDALASHARDELGLADARMARPWQAAWASAAAFTAGACVPVLCALAPGEARVPLVVVVALAALCLLGAIGARLGGAPMGRAALRVGLWGAAAMALTAAIGALVGTAV